MHIDFGMGLCYNSFKKDYDYMKKVIFGCTLMLVGVICGTGYILAFCSACVEPGAWSSMLNIFYNTEGIIPIVFYLLSIFGAVIVIKALKEEK